MGKIVEMRGKKKKGRPSLLDLQKRGLNLQQHQREENLTKKLQNPKLKRTHNHFQNPNPTPVRRSSHRNQNPDLDSPGTTDDNSVSDPKDEDELSSSRNHKRRKVETIRGGSEQKGKEQDRTNQANSHQEAELDDGPSTPLPDKTLLVFILDSLQKKDTYGVFAEPVDPEELPDYHEVIDHPMDFGTIRNNLKNGVYKKLEQFERDVFLLCSNAMQYNAPGTIYFRQARTIQELANKNFEDLRQDRDDHEPQIKIVKRGRGRPPTKHLKKPVDRSLLERANSKYPEITLAAQGENTNLDLRKATSLEKYGSASSLGHISYGSRHGEVCLSLSGDKYDRRNSDISDSMPKYILVKHGKEQIILDENRRYTYKLSGLPLTTTRQDHSMFLTFCGVRQQLLPVGIHSKYGYARSLARFAAKLGPVAWKIAKKKLEGCLPTSVRFGPGWVGEDEAVNMLNSQYQTPSRPTSGTVDGDGGGNGDDGTRLSMPLAHVSKPGSETQAQESTLIQSNINCINGISPAPSELPTAASGFKSGCSSSVATSSATVDDSDSPEEDTLMEGRKLTEETSSTGEYANGYRCPASAKYEQPSELELGSVSEEKRDPIQHDLNIGFESPVNDQGSALADLAQQEAVL